MVKQIKITRNADEMTTKSDQVSSKYTEIQKDYLELFNKVPLKDIFKKDHDICAYINAQLDSLTDPKCMYLKITTHHSTDNLLVEDFADFHRFEKNFFDNLAKWVGKLKELCKEHKIDLKQDKAWFFSYEKDLRTRAE